MKVYKSLSAFAEANETGVCVLEKGYERIKETIPVNGENLTVYGWTSYGYYVFSVEKDDGTLVGIYDRATYEEVTEEIGAHGYMTDPKIIADRLSTKKYNGAFSDGWKYEDCLALCEMAGLGFDYYAAYDVDFIEGEIGLDEYDERLRDIVLHAADILGVEIKII